MPGRAITERVLTGPDPHTRAGYRLYSAADATRLDRILAYRACGLPLGEIAAALDDDDPVGHLRRQLELLDARRNQLDRQRDTLRRSLEAHIMGITLDPEELMEVFGDHDPTQYAQEAEERWGTTDAYRESHRRTSSYTKVQWQRLGAQSAEIESEFASCLSAGLPADSARAKAAAEAHRRHLDTWFYPCSYELQTGLADMYVADERFARHYDEQLPGLAAYVSAAIWANATERAS